MTEYTVYVHLAGRLLGVLFDSEDEDKWVNSRTTWHHIREGSTLLILSRFKIEITHAGHSFQW
jgi:hypothetical protein